ncbi:MAG: hypothetical protein EU539_07910 [Promethearchaeota archaeon]|nr:MAG: hypothetical protein EU539_07910 [Candidatus Lokiarchaeota archaeon]
MNHTILIKNGLIMDGTGASAFKADLLVSEEKINEIGDLKGIDASEIIDAEGLAVAPGFIDVHSHLDFLLPSDQRIEVLENWIRQGCTTIVSGNCGYSPAPINHEYDELINTYWNFALPKDGLKYEWTSMAEFLSHLEKIGQVVNVVLLTGHNTLRTNVMGFQKRFADAEDLNEMKRLLKESIDAGSFGLSLGLGYVPGIYSNTEELIELASVLTEYKLPIVPHTRGIFSKLYAKAIEEVIIVAEKNNIPLHISHHAGGGIGRIRKLSLKAVEEGIDRGIKIGHDNIPWAISCGPILGLFPPWLFDGGLNLEQLNDKKIRQKVIDEISNIKPKWPPWENNYWVDKEYNDFILLSGFREQKNKKFENMRLKDIANELNKKPIEAFIDLVIEENGELYFHSGQFDNPMAEDFLGTLFSNPNCSIGTDIVGAGLNTISPVAYGNFTKVLGTFAREKELFTQEEAVRKMTSLPAEQMQIKDRGIIKRDYFADITIFNPKEVMNQSSYTKPYELSEGIEHVLVNGKIMLERGKFHAKNLAGKVLRKGRN